MSSAAGRSSSGATPAAADPPLRTIGYLGPPGTFTEQAVHSQPDLGRMRHRPLGSIAEVLGAVAGGEVDLGLVAIENMIEGSVTATIDALAFDTDLLIQREIVMGVNLNLLVKPGGRLDQVERISSYPVAYAQCRSYLSQHLPGVPFRAANSTADAARELAEGDDAATAVIATRRSAEVYGLEVLAAGIEDRPKNQTRFVLVGSDGITPPSGHDKTSMLIYQRTDAPGSLIGILQEFAARAINLTSLQSRPTKAGLGHYCFLVDCEGHVADELVADALRNLMMKTARVKFLGSYPSAYGSDQEQIADRARVVEAEAWVESLRGRIIS